MIRIINGRGAAEDSITLMDDGAAVPGPQFHLSFKHSEEPRPFMVAICDEAVELTQDQAREIYSWLGRCLDRAGAT